MTEARYGLIYEETLNPDSLSLPDFVPSPPCGGRVPGHEFELKILDPRWGAVWPLPGPATEGAAAFDLRVTKSLVLPPGAWERFPTGLAIHLGDRNLALLAVPRSGLGTSGLVMGNLVAVIDSDYQGEIFLCLWNRTEDEVFRITAGDRVAQALIVPVIRPEFKVVEEFSTQTARGEGGCGHTGTR
jgi:dUTP pyrophosphatase